MHNLLEFDDQNFNSSDPELKDEVGRTEGRGSWDSPEDETQDQGEGSVLNSEVVLAEPGLKDEIQLPEDLQDGEVPPGDDEEEEDQKNTPPVGSRRVVSFSDYFGN